MTREEEAIKELTRELSNWERDCKSKHPMKDALCLAIEALEAKSCEDAVSRKAAVVQLHHNKTGDDDIDVIIEKDIATIQTLPPVTPTRKKGKWIKHDTGHSVYYDCSLCGCTAPHIEVADKILWKLSNYCPDCGAKMEAEE